MIYLLIHFMKRFCSLLMIVFSGINLTGFAQTHAPPVTVPVSMKSFVTKSYEVLDITESDLNRDACLDAVMMQSLQMLTALQYPSI